MAGDPVSAAIERGISTIALEIPRCDAERHGAELYGAPGFSVFSLFGDRETTLSRVLADLLDPNGSHGQGLVFVNALLEMLKLDRLSRLDRSVDVRTEAPVPVKGRDTNRRIDILIETSDRLIGIENKKWTGQSENQLADYWAYLQGRAGSRLRPVLIYISNEDPGDRSIIKVPYYDEDEQNPSIDRLLRLARRDVKASRISDFVDDFCSWIGRTFAGSESSGMDVYKETVLSAIRQSGNPEQRKAVGAVLLSKRNIIRAYICNIEEHIVQHIKAEIPNISVVETPDRNNTCPLCECIENKWWWWALRCPDWPAHCFLYIQSNSGGRRSLIYGVGALDPESSDGKDPKHEHYRSERIAELDQAVSAYSSDGRRSPWSRWDKSLPTADWTAEAIGIALVLGERFPGEYFGVGKLIEDFIGLAKAINAIKSK
ncbi:PD-(D/E)XK nuclease family protein [Amorphus coralli]|uniref:PDDEXK-like family protein n=1 Tax=Amorphus coralli TaxID=340680 RepID=UPI0009FDBC84|nr:PD-(D/E)XK nuclease family protein [Amorphus coralli]